ncbi:MAG TPA: SCO family protein [Blastocatellia bacterium]|nr:SCO family protein [Blastocatellia bacterium]
MKSRSLKLFVIGALILSTPLILRSQGAIADTSQQQQKDIVYVCPMHPEVKSETAGTCRKCDMKLKQVSASEATRPRTRYGPDYFPNFTLITQDGKQVRFYDDLLKDKIVAINLIYTTCKYKCPIETALLAEVQRIMGDQVGKEIFFYSISIEPKHDTPEVLKAYAERFKVGPGWLFLTGKEEEIEIISKKLGLYSRPSPSDPDGHTPTLLVGNVAAGNWMRLSALDNVRFLARKLTEMIDNRKRARPDILKGTQASAPLKLDTGQYLFGQRCSACHTIGEGHKVGPDLLGITSRRNPAWLRRYISVPDKMLAEKDPIALYLFNKYKEVRMPNQGLHEVDVAAIIRYIDERTAALRAAESAGKKPAEAKQNPEK